MGRLTPDGFALRFDACSQALWCVAAAIVGDRHQAEDVLQEAAIVALRKLDEFDPASAFTAWMGRIVRYVALNHARRRAHRKALSFDDADIFVEPAAATAAASVTSRGELPAHQASFDDRLMAALLGLEETARACLLLRVVLELPYRDIALALGVRESTAMSHVHRSRRALSQRLAPDPCPVANGSLP